MRKAELEKGRTKKTGRRCVIATVTDNYLPLFTGIQDRNKIPGKQGKNIGEDSLNISGWEIL